MPVSTAKHRNTLIAVAALVIGVVIAYLPTIQAGFIWDDNDYVTSNYTLRDLNGLARIWTDFHSIPQWYPLVHTTFWVEYQLYGDTPAGYHIDNVLLHVLSTLLLWRLLSILRVPGAMLAAFLFGLHPIYVESVAWVTERKNTLSGFLYLASMIACVRWFALDDGDANDAATKPRIPLRSGTAGWGVIAFVLFLGAVLSKSVTCSLPAAFLLIVWWKRATLTRRDWLRMAPFFVAGLLAGLNTARLEKELVGAVGSEWDYAPTAIGEFLYRTLIAGRSIWFYAYKLVAPIDLAFIYPRFHIDPAAAWQYAFPIAAVLVVVVLFLLRNRIGRGPLVAVLFFGGTLFPALGYFNVYPHRYSFVADHFQHLASLGLLVLIAALLAHYTRNMPGMPRLAGAVVLCAVLGVLTYRQATAYDSFESIWADTLRKNPDSWMVQTNYAHALKARNDLAGAAEHYERSMALRENAETVTNVAQIRAMNGQTDEALRLFDRAIELNPKYPLARVGKAVALASLGRADEAIALLQRVLDESPDNAIASRRLAALYADAGALGNAITLYRRAVVAMPDDASVRFELGAALMRLAQRDQKMQFVPEAASQLERALAIEPSRVSGWVQLGYARLLLQDVIGARRAFEVALKLDANSADAQRGLALLQQMPSVLPR